MKATVELPDELMRRIKIRAAASDCKLKDTFEELIRRGLDAAEAEPPRDPISALRKRLTFHADGGVTNPDGIDDPAFFDALEE
ncbi:MAG: hypothetical protein V2J10_09400, partial [Wenzhouxiangella sp.]|nr:hypothetical protein [Wenzhouxiangella sp.]